MLNEILNIRNIFSKNVKTYLLPENFSIISDDCWGGQIYIQLSIPYLTPTVGLCLHGDDYFNFLINLDAFNATEFYDIKSEETYPIGQTPYAKLHFMHYNTLNVAKDTFKRRYQRINWNNLFYKIDLEKPCYTKKHIELWNDLDLPNSLAFYSKKVVNIWDGKIHNGVYIDNWVIDGAKMFDISRSHFNIFNWITNGKIV